MKGVAPSWCCCWDPGRDSSGADGRRGDRADGDRALWRVFCANRAPTLSDDFIFEYACEACGVSWNAMGYCMGEFYDYP